MRTLVLTVAAVALTVASAAPAQEAAPGVWRAMTFHDFSTPSTVDPLQTIVWPDVIREQNAYITTQLKRPLHGRNALLTALSSNYREGERTIIVSVASSRACDHGANSKGAEIEASACPVRIATLQDGRLLNLKTVAGCYADHSDPDLPSRNRTDGNFTRFDPVAGTIALRTSVGGKDVPACARTFSVR
ncbi:hypothetical protein [uncultured Enterovirga sp.]|uniref:hypothetical protein n=1 Tax=uncultured Enterovirga sp. TaxID=2026352 RepID=UPI0035CB4058